MVALTISTLCKSVLCSSSALVVLCPYHFNTLALEEYRLGVGVHGFGNVV